jgi:ribosomal protein S27AE
MALPYTPDERHALERSVAGGRMDCPRCGGTLDVRDVPPRSEVSYVRDRVWLVCARCGGSAVLDRRRIGRAHRSHRSGPP